MATKKATKAPKPVKVWALVDDDSGRIERVYSVSWTKAEVTNALSMVAGHARVIRVLVTPVSS